MTRRFKLGDVYSWQEPDNKYRTIAAMTDDKDCFYQVAIHHKGDSNIDAASLDTWFADFPEKGYTDFKRASEPEIIELILALLKGRMAFRVTKEQQVIMSECEKLPDKQQRWKGYLVELCNYHLENPSLKNFSALKRKYHIQGVTTKQFYTLGLNTLSSDDIDHDKVIEIMNLVYNKK